MPERRCHSARLRVHGGALADLLRRALRELDKHSRLRTTHDSTVYGVGRASPRTFLAHHVAAHSSAVVMADAITVSR